MKKIIAVIVGVVVIGGVIWFATAGNGDNGQAVAIDSATFADLINRGQKLNCTFMGSDEGGVVNGQAYIDGNQVRGTYNLVDPSGAASELNVLSDGSYNYVWGNTPIGQLALKLAVVPADNIDAEQSAWDYTSDTYDFNCERWNGTVGDTFTPPSDINFSELDTDQLDIDASQFGDGAADICSSCDQAPTAETKAQCLQALSSFGC